MSKSKKIGLLSKGEGYSMTFILSKKSCEHLYSSTDMQASVTSQINSSDCSKISQMHKIAFFSYNTIYIYCCQKLFHFSLFYYMGGAGDDPPTDLRSWCHFLIP